MRLLAIIGCALLCGASVGCVSPHKTYLPPSNVKVTASTKKVTDGAAAAHSASREAKTHVQAAQKHNDALLVTGLVLQQKLDAIIKLAPVELQPALAAVKQDAMEMQGHLDGIKTELDGAYAKQNETEAHQIKLDQDIVQLKKDQAEYYSNAQGLADNATQEREDKIKVQKKLLWYRIRFWGAWIALGSAVVVGIILWIAKGAAKFGIKTAI